jgi:anti-anti-sigma factor
MNLTLTVETSRTAAGIRICGDLDYVSTDHLVQTATRLLTDRPELKSLRLDFAELDFCDSAGLSGLLLIHRRTEQHDVQLHLDHRTGQLERILQITGTLGHLTALRHTRTELDDESDAEIG